MSGRFGKKRRKQEPEILTDNKVINMRKARQGRKRRKPTSAKQKIFVIVIIILLLIVLSSMNNIIKLKQLEHEAEQEVASLKAQKSELEEKVQEIDSSDYIEQQARNWLKMAKQGDRVYILSGDSMQQNEDITQEEEEADASSHQKNSDQGL